MKKEITSDVDMALPGCSTSTPASAKIIKWTTLFAEGKLSRDMFREYWYNKIPAKCVLDVSGCVDISASMESLGSTSELITELEEFIFCNGYREVLNDYLTKCENVQSLCAKPFKNGEPSYNCKQCSIDATCVMCVECFQTSAHRFHKYRMSTSGGGGFCDCGDPEAWKSEPFCESHGPHPIQEDIPRPELPLDVYERCKFVFSFGMQFALDVVNKHFTSDMRSQLSSIEEPIGNFSLVMYNDEVHTFDQVINILVQVVSCTPREGLAYASKINKEGRAVIKTSDFRSCCRMKSDIERLSSQDGNQYLEVHVLPFSVVAYQTFSLNLLSWMQNVLKTCVEFRSAFVEVLKNNISNGTSPILLDTILLQDPELWKFARKQWNLLICSGMLMENEHKMVLGIQFVKNFHSIMKNYIVDDEDHPFSIACLSVQLLTVPSIAYTLIADHNALKSVVDFLIIISSNDRNADGKLEFSRSLSYKFERASFTLHDARYLLCSPPLVWSDALRAGFLAGTSSFLDLLSFVEGMDAVTRQLGTHIEFEPEWETAFKLIFKIHPVITQLYEWCATDRTVLLEVYKMVLTKLKAIYSDSWTANILNSFGIHQVNCIPFEVTKDQITVHLPLTRFLGGLHLLLGNFEIEFSCDELSFPEKPLPLELIEHVARTRTMISQFRSGMWRKNGHSLANQIFLYHSPKFRGMMLDMDITVLQMGASLIDSNTFLINLLYKFGILDWNDGRLFSKLPETDATNLRTLVEEFLHLIIMLTSERYQVGVGKVSQIDCTRYEMTHLLSVRPMPHSELIRAVSSKSKAISEEELVINDMSIFKTEDNYSGKSHYVLKDGYPSYYNPYFFHFSKEDMFKSEQAMKVRHKKFHDLECCPPPVLPTFCKDFVRVSDLLKSDVLLRMMNMIFNACMKNAECSGYEGQLDKVLFLIGTSLREEERLNSQFGFCDQAKKWDISELLVNAYSSPHFKDQKDMMKWLLVKYQNITNDSVIAEAIKQRENLIESESEQQLKKSLLAAKARENIMAKMKSMQEKFANKNASVFASKDVAVEQETTVMSLNEFSDFESGEQKKVTCMLCQEDEQVKIKGRPIVLAVYVQLSSVLRRNKRLEMSAQEEADKVYLSSNLGPSPYVCTCGHAMHAECFVAWRVESIRRNNNNAPTLPASVDTSKDEYLCPLCGCISNAVLLYLPPVGNNPIVPQSSNVSFAQWLKIAVTVLHITKHNQPRNIPVIEAIPIPAQQFYPSPPSATSEDPNDIKAFIFRLEDNSSDRTKKDACSSTLNKEQPATPNTKENAGFTFSSGEGWILNIKKYTEESFGDELLRRNQLPRDGMYWINDLSNRIYASFVGKRPCEAINWSPVHFWKTVAYTIHSVENNLRYTGRPLLGAFTAREEQCLENLIRISFSMGEHNQAKLLINKKCLQLLSFIIENEPAHPCILEWDSFGLLMVLLVSVPNIVHANNSTHVIFSMRKFLQRILLVSQVAQCLIAVDLSKIGPSEGKKTSNDTDCLLFLASLVRQNYTAFNTDAVWDVLKDNARQFLRSCVILLHFYSPKSDLCGLDQTGYDTYENLCAYLQLPVSCKELLGDEVTQSLFVTWAKHPSMNDLFKDTSLYLVPNALTINDLVKLPNDYSELLNKVRHFSCSNSNLDDSQNPTMCLVCGEILCSLSYCCQKELNNKKVGACTYHAHHCGGGVGIFLKIRECQLVMFAGLGRELQEAEAHLVETWSVRGGLTNHRKRWVQSEQLAILLKAFQHRLKDILTSISLKFFENFRHQRFVQSS
ncbi:hypothetical protein GE061_019180 [Apolygus lucorum]|uniref:E3 ubiquitin-protein ligase n=1 Tax=Apolygus lucorum TaxID=248454 RepID=A0A8S9X7S5_APOLU|nr:hypothetical protein GE061_019180 [Apolygus lucorum]